MIGDKLTPEGLKEWWEGFQMFNKDLPNEIAAEITKKINSLKPSPVIDPVTGATIHDDFPTFLKGPRGGNQQPDA